ncbi:hypothetical protein ELUMI_v1c08360 [Williamsoniiplasma luminosum]|uniref:Lipoprotein n=1 Tax=Williamsoniiplasma luminosum TaxID=214888 RepID=A0A2K8NUW7_9MOLU|nr:lipoprotein [Williamsoniiplasma luminosum]ATZ17557.1 hypothetical protein ELUMI_v1c08360 [Williamsoniiplasma luminosum]
MKKLLSFLGTTIFVASSALTVVSCVHNNQEDKNSNLTPLQAEMLDGANFISRLIIGGRHENLNYNVNEVLSMYLTPQATAMQMPVAYKYNEQKINLGSKISNYKNLLAPWIKGFDEDGYAGMFASYVMGMYDDNFYQKMFNPGSDSKGYFEDTFSKGGNVGYNKKKDNAMGYAAGLGKNAKLSADENRRNLAWGIQDTGALSNYLLHNGFDGAYPTNTNGTEGPKSSANENNKGTNGSGYAWYNSILYAGNASQSRDYKDQGVQNKLDKGLIFLKADDNTDFKSTVHGFKFNSTGALITATAGKLNLDGKISLMASLLENFSSTKSGALNLAEFSNFLLPMIVDPNFPPIIIPGLPGFIPGTTFQTMQGITFSLITKIWETFKKHRNEFPENTWSKIDALDKAPEPVNGVSPTKELNIQYLFNKQGRDINNPGTNAKDIVDIINLLDKESKLDTTTEGKKNFYQKYFEDRKTNNTPFATVYHNIISKMVPGDWNSVLEQPDAGINLLNYAKNIYKAVSEKPYQDQLLAVIEKFKDKKYFRELSSNEQSNFLELLGYKGDKYVDDSVLKGLYEGVKNESVVPGKKEFKEFFSKFGNSTSQGMEKAHENVISNLYDNNFWNMTEVKFESTSNSQKGAKMHYTLNYTGKGDTTSTANQQFKKVNVDQNFNPYQTIIEHQKDVISETNTALIDKLDLTKKSGKVLGVEQNVIAAKDLQNYDGLGNYQDYKDVNHTYKISWENISDNPNNPYWVITTIKSFDQNGKEFFNIY